MADKCCTPFFVPDADSLRESLAQSLGPVVDCARNLEAVLGVRPYQVAMVWTRWTGEARGEGVEENVREALLLPSPLLTDQNGLDLSVAVIGSRETGQLTLKEVSPRFTDAELRGGALASNEDFFYEIRWFAGQEREPLRRRYTLSGPPSYEPREFQWTLDLVLQQQPRLRDGDTDMG